MSDKSKNSEVVKMILQWFITTLDMIKYIALWLLELLCFVGAGVLVALVVLLLLDGQMQEGIVAALSSLILVVLSVLIDYNQDKPPAKRKKLKLPGG